MSGEPDCLCQVSYAVFMPGELDSLCQVSYAVYARWTRLFMPGELDHLCLVSYAVLSCELDCLCQISYAVYVKWAILCMLGEWYCACQVSYIHTWIHSNNSFCEACISEKHSCKNKNVKGNILQLSAELLSLTGHWL